MPDLESGKSASERNIINKSRIKNTKINCNQRESKKIKNELFNHYLDYSSPSNMLSRLSDSKGDGNKNQVYLIKQSLAKTKNIIRTVPENKRFKIEKNEKIILLKGFFSLIAKTNQGQNSNF